MTKSILLSRAINIFYVFIQFTQECITKTQKEVGMNDDRPLIERLSATSGDGVHTALGFVPYTTLVNLNAVYLAGNTSTS